MQKTPSQLAHDEQLLRLVIRQHARPINEGIANDLAKDAIQYAVSAAAEYGVGGAIAVGSFGAGSAAVPAAETAVDAAFSAKEVKETIEAVADAAKNAGEFASMLNQAIDAFGGDFSGYYDKLRPAVQTVVSKMSEDGKAKIDDIVEQLKEVVENIVSEVIGAIESGVKLVIPDATAGLAAAKAVGVAIKSLSENAYDTLTSAIESVDLLNKAITSPAEVVKYFEEILASIAAQVVEVGKYFNEMGWAKAILAGGPVGGVIIKKLGPKGFQELSEMLEKAIPGVVSVVNAVLTKVIPALFACLGIYQILMKGEYKSETEKNESVLVTRRQLRSMIQETLTTTS